MLQDFLSEIKGLGNPYGYKYVYYFSPLDFGSTSEPNLGKNDYNEMELPILKEKLNELAAEQRFEECAKIKKIIEKMERGEISPKRGEEHKPQGIIFESLSLGERLYIVSHNEKIVDDKEKIDNFPEKCFVKHKESGVVRYVTFSNGATFGDDGFISGANRDRDCHCKDYEII